MKDLSLKKHVKIVWCQEATAVFGTKKDIDKNAECYLVLVCICDHRNLRKAILGIYTVALVGLGHPPSVSILRQIFHLPRYSITSRHAQTIKCATCRA